MKSLTFFEKILFYINSLLAVLFLISLLLPYVKPSIFPLLSILSLFSPLIIIINILFVFFWITKLKKEFLLSFIVLAIGYGTVVKFVNFSNNTQYISENSLSVISYNVRLFNLYKWIDRVGVDEEIYSFLQDENTDIICLQEYKKNNLQLSSYNYSYEFLRGKNSNYGQAIFSKFPIINKGSIDLESNSNSAIFSDIIIRNDTIRIYNIHLQSFTFDKNIQLSDINSRNNIIVGSVSNTFIDQQNQVEILQKHIEKCPYKLILSGDFNNTAFSYTYNKLKDNLNDSFIKKGNGLGITYNYNFIPMRIDYILLSKDFRVNKFKTYKINLSDHEPIFSEIIF
ncbi:MAG: endonuclease [Flavobacteriaceae bacterium]|nr:endonuclease [Flavobacteriaceae bacterium]|tara:strand:+ start:38018 stop:39037 length:1020 start_codon:yes stop_codon:yes gene_type:complete